MVQRSGYRLGELCWADVQTPDVAAAKVFYAAVFGWCYEDLPTPDGRSYAKAFLADDLVVTVAPQPRQGNTNQPARWNVYFATDDARSTAEEADHAGGSTNTMVPVSPMSSGPNCTAPPACGRPAPTRAAGGTTSPVHSPGPS